MGFNIQNPEWLVAFFPLLVLCGLQLYRWQAQRLAFSWRRFFCTLLGFSCGILALSRIQMGTYELRATSQESDVYFAVDISKSMLAEDVLPNRLQMEITLAQKILEGLGHSRFALFPFSGDGFLWMPLTSDPTLAKDMLSDLNPTLTTETGTGLTTSLHTLLEIILKRQKSTTEARSTLVVLLSDGESQHPMESKTLQEFAAKRIPIFTIGVGSTQGTQILQRVGFNAHKQPVRDSHGRPVITKLVSKNLETIANETHGLYTIGRIDQMDSLIKRLKRNAVQGNLESHFSVQSEFFPILLLLSIFFLTFELFAVRWEYLVRLGPWFIFLLPAPSWAWSDEIEEKLKIAGKNRAEVAYNEALAALQAQNFSDASDLFLESASNTENGSLKKKALYNLGNSKLREQDPIQALAAYQQSIETKANTPELEKEATGRASDNMVLAAKMQLQMMQEKGDGNKEKPGDQPQDPGGPKKDFKAQDLSNQKKEQIFKLSAEQEREIRSRLQQEKNQKKGIRSSKNDW